MKEILVGLPVVLLLILALLVIPNVILWGLMFTVSATLVLLISWGIGMFIIDLHRIYNE